MEHQYNLVRQLRGASLCARVSIRVQEAEFDSVSCMMPDEVEQGGFAVTAQSEPGWVEGALAGIHRVLNVTGERRTTRYHISLIYLGGTEVDTSANAAWIAAACCVWEVLFPDEPAPELIFDRTWGLSGLGYGLPLGWG